MYVNKQALSFRTMCIVVNAPLVMYVMVMCDLG